MTETEPNPLETILRLCAAAAPNPWYPSAYAQTSGVPRDGLDPYLDRLRLGGFIQLTEWVQGRGQGYALTPSGAQLLEQPRLLSRLRGGELPAKREEVRRPAATGTSTTWERGEAARAALLTYSPPVVTVALIFANVAVFLAGIALAARAGEPLNQVVYQSSPLVLDRTGAVSAADVLVRHQWWRLLTCCFVHIGLIHLGVNMYSLYAVGPLLERMWGRWYFLLLYLVAGFGGSCAMVMDNPIATGAGASGALFGILASMVTWIFLNRRVLPPSLISEWRRQLAVVFVLNLAITFGIANISKGAHLGGAAVGLLAAVPVDYLRYGRWSERLLAVAALAGIPVACVGLMERSFERNADRIQRVQEEREGRDFLLEFEPGIEDVDRRAAAVFKRDVQPLRDRHPSRRDNDKVGQVLDKITDIERDLGIVERRLEQAAPYSTTRIEKERQRAIKYLQEWVKLFELSRNCLQKGEEWTAQDEQELRRQRARIAGAQ